MRENKKEQCIKICILEYRRITGLTKQIMRRGAKLRLQRSWREAADMSMAKLKMLMRLWLSIVKAHRIDETAGEVWREVAEEQSCGEFRRPMLTGWKSAGAHIYHLTTPFEHVHVHVHVILKPGSVHLHLVVYCVRWYTSCLIGLLVGVLSWTRSRRRTWQAAGVLCVNYVRSSSYKKYSTYVGLF